MNFNSTVTSNALVVAIAALALQSACNEVRVGASESDPHAEVDADGDAGTSDAPRRDGEGMYQVEGAAYVWPRSYILGSGYCFCEFGELSTGHACQEWQWLAGVPVIDTFCAMERDWQFTGAQLDYLDCLADEVFLDDAGERVIPTAACGLPWHPTYTEYEDCMTCVQEDVDRIVAACGDPWQIGLVDALAPCVLGSPEDP